jgi:hypothetical protein
MASFESGDVVVPGITQPPYKSLNAGLRTGWYEPRFSEFEACWFVGMGFISLALNPAPVEEQPVAKTTATERIAADNLIWFKNLPEQWLQSNLGLPEGHEVLIICWYIFIRWLHSYLPFFVGIYSSGAIGVIWADLLPRRGWRFGLFLGPEGAVWSLNIPRTIPGAGQDALLVAAGKPGQLAYERG